jgi:hypothetical protein
MEQDREGFGTERIRILRTGYILVGLPALLMRLADSNKTKSQGLRLDS